MRRLSPFLSSLLVAASLTVPAAATTLIRMDVQDLVSRNESAVLGHVVDMATHWNADNTFMLTDVRIAVDQTLMGRKAPAEVAFTVMGGAIGDLSTVIVGGPELVLGAPYVVFLGREDLPGTPSVLTIRDLCQGIFDVVPTMQGIRAVSQATQHPLLADDQGYYEAPGGREGLSLDELTHEIRNLAPRK